MSSNRLFWAVKIVISRLRLLAFQDKFRVSSRSVLAPTGRRQVPHLTVVSLKNYAGVPIFN